MTDRNEMTEPFSCQRDAAPYVLGALEPGEASAFARHLERCAVCRDEVAALSPVLDALTAAAPAPAAPPALRRRVLRAVQAEPRVRDIRRPGRVRAVISSREAGWLAFSAAMAATAVLQLSGTGSHERVIPSSIGTAQLRVNGNHGELVAEHLAALPADRTYEVWLESGGQTPTPSTLFAANSRGSADVGVRGDLRGVSRVLVTVEPRDGSLGPTMPAVIQVPLSNVQRS